MQSTFVKNSSVFEGDSCTNAAHPSPRRQIESGRASTAHRPETPRVVLISPLRLFVMLMAVTFLAESLVMFALPFLLRNASWSVEAIVDSTLLTLMIAPFVWIVVIRPLQKAALFEKARAAAVISHAVDGILTLNDKGDITSCNPAAEAMFGFKERPLADQPIASPPHDASRQIAGDEADDYPSD